MMAITTSSSISVNPRRMREDENNMGQLLRKPKDMDTHTTPCSAGGCAAERG